MAWRSVVSREFAIHHPIVHLVLAMHMAFLSPVLCCCTIRSAIGHVTGCIGVVGDANCCFDSSASLECSVCDEEDQPACCCDEIDDDDVSDTPSQRKCPCKERAIERLPLNTGFKVQIPPLVEFANVTAPLICDALPKENFQSLPHEGYGHESRCGHQQSLLRQRCLLQV